MVKSQKILNTEVIYTGEGPNVLILHPGALCLGAMIPHLELLSKNGFKAYSIDLYKIASDINTPCFDLFSERLHQIIVELKITNCIIIAHSFGGGIALSTAAMNPNWLEGLILCETVGWPITNRPFLKWLEMAFSLKRNPRYPKSGLKGSLELLIKNPLGLARASQMALEADLRSSINKIKEIKTVYLWGEKAKFIPLENGQNLHNYTKNSQLYTFSNLPDHVWFNSQPDTTWLPILTSQFNNNR